MIIAELDLTLRSAANDTIVADLSLYVPDQSDQATPVESVPVTIDEAALYAAALDAEAYGRTLARQLFADNRLSEAWNQMIGFSKVRNAQLRLRLRLHSAIEKLHVLHWEKLYDPASDQPLCLSEQILFSRYVFGGDPGVAPPSHRSELRALVAVASPANLATYRLDPIDAQAQLQIAADALRGTVPTTTLGGAAGQPPASLAGLGQALRDGAQIVYLVCHGRLVDGQPHLWLERDDRSSDIVSGQQIVRQISRLPAARRPGLVILAVCHSAGGDDPAMVASTLAPQLVRAGVRAVIGMHGLAPIAMVERLIPELLKRLLSDGLVDQALAGARAALPEHMQLPWWTPVLFMRATDGRIWTAEEPAQPGLSLPFEQPRVPDTYVTRREAEAGLLQAVTGVGNAPVTVLYGMSGIGKTSLAARVAQQLKRWYLINPSWSGQCPAKAMEHHPD